MRRETRSEMRTAVVRPLVMAGEDICHSHGGHRLFCLDTEGHALLFDAPRAIQRDAQSVFLAHDVARPEVFLRKLISGGKVEIRKIAMACRRIPALSDGIGNEIRGIEHFRTVMEAVQVVMVGHDGKRVIRNTGAHVVPPADELEHEGFILVGDGIGTAGRRIAPFVDELHQNPCAFAGRAGAFGKRTAQVIADAAVFDAVGVFHAFAGCSHAVGHDDHAAFVDKAVGGGQPAGILAVFRPVIAERMGNLRDFGAALLSGHDAACRPILRGNPAVANDDIAAVVFVMSNKHAPCRAGFFAGDERHAVHFIPIKHAIASSNRKGVGAKLRSFPLILSSQKPGVNDCVLAF